VSELRKDPVTGRWVIISTDRRKRPTDFRLESVHIAPDPSCPFCEGHESMTPPEILAVRNNGSGSNQEGWDLRVVPNQFPVLRVEGTLDRQGEGLFDKMNGIGAHEVIIETPHHLEQLASMPDDAIERVLWSVHDRMLDLQRDTRFRYIIAFKNHGVAAGASLDHSHSQIIALPIVPREVRDEVDGAKAHFQAKERCVFCDILRQEKRAKGSASSRRTPTSSRSRRTRRGSRSRRGCCRGATSRTSRTPRATSTRRWRGCSATSCGA